VSGNQPSNPWQRMTWGLRVLRAYARIGWVRKSQFRWEFVNQVVMDLLFYVSSIATFTMLYALGGDTESGRVSLAGWSLDEMKVFLGMTFVADALMMTFQGQQWHFGSDLKNGALDPFRVRPGPTAFLYFYQRFSPEGLSNLVIASGWLVYALSGVVGTGPEALVTPWHLAWTLPCAIALLAWAQIFISLFYCLVELWLMHSDLGHLASGLFHTMADRPMEVYPAGLSRFLLYVVPVAALSWFPSSLVLGQLSLGFALAYPLVLVVFAWVVVRIFRLGLRRYDSAMG
jgi:ABC-2 type transport system permease protein